MISDRLVQAEKHMETVDKRLALDYKIDSIINQSGLGLASRYQKERLVQLVKEREQLNNLLC